MAAFVGRLRPCPVLDYKFVALGHNTVRGAAGAAVLNAELMKSEGYARLMIVMKFGGTSVESADAIERVAGIVRDRLDRHPVVVVSAMGKTTNKLLAIAAKPPYRGDAWTSSPLRSTGRSASLSLARSAPVGRLAERAELDTHARRSISSSSRSWSKDSPCWAN